MPVHDRTCDGLLSEMFPSVLLSLAALLRRNFVLGLSLTVFVAILYIHLEYEFAMSSARMS